jgi:hypothetical protein
MVIFDVSDILVLRQMLLCLLLMLSLLMLRVSLQLLKSLLLLTFLLLLAQLVATYPAEVNVLAAVGVPVVPAFSGVPDLQKSFLLLVLCCCWRPYFCWQSCVASILPAVGISLRRNLCCGCKRPAVVVVPTLDYISLIACQLAVAVLVHNFSFETTLFKGSLTRDFRHQFFS